MSCRLKLSQSKQVVCVVIFKASTLAKNFWNCHGRFYLRPDNSRMYGKEQTTSFLLAPLCQMHENNKVFKFIYYLIKRTNKNKNTEQNMAEIGDKVRGKIDH